MRRRTLSAVIVIPLTIGLLLRNQVVQSLFITDPSPRRAIYHTHPWLLWTNISLDILSATSYALFFGGIWWLVRRLRNIPELRDYFWFSTALKVFILASGATQIAHIVTLWWPVFLLSTVLKLVCAAASVPTAILFALQAAPMAATIGRFFTLMKAEHEHGEELRESQELLDRTGRIAGVGGWTLDLHTHEIRWTAETFLIHGVDPSYKPTLSDSLDFFTPEFRPALEEAIARARDTGHSWDLEAGMVRADGRHIWVRTVGQVDLRDGESPRLIGALQDKTAQIAVRKELRQANERVALATDSGGIGIFDWDIDQDLCTSDPWMHRLYDIESPGRSTPLAYWAQNMHPEDRPAVIQALDDAIADKKPYDTEFRVVWNDGSIHHLRATGKVTRDVTGRALHMVGANWDVTESRRLTAELAEQHDLLRVTLNSIGDGVITVDSLCNIAWLNPAAERMTGWPTAEAVGHPLTEIFHTLNEDTRQIAESPVAGCLVDGNAVGLAQHTLLVSRDGSEFGIENLAAPIRDKRGDLLGNVLVFRDVTEQRRLAAETDRNAKLKSELKLKDEFLSHVSHELRSPLTSIYSFTSIIADDLAGETTPEQKEYLHVVLKNVVQLQAMIEDLLTVTQSREGKLGIELQRVPAHDAIADAFYTVQNSAITKRITLSRCDCTPLSPVCADPTRLRQVLIILLDNAVKFTPHDGSVSVDAAEKEIGLIHFRVIDTGCGIPDDKKKLVFENLYQITGPGHSDTSQSGRTGLGLGLHIARNLITRQGGNIWVTDSPSGGSVFNFTLPIYSEDRSLEAENSPRRRKTDRLPDSISTSEAESTRAA